MRIHNIVFSALAAVLCISGCENMENVEGNESPGQQGQQEQEEGGGISSAEELLAFAKAVNNGESLAPFQKDGIVILLQDIDLSGVTEWIPAGTMEHPFSGIFDGKGKTIRNIGCTINASAYRYAGIFGYAENAIIRNLYVGEKDGRIEISGDVSELHAGGIAGYTSGGGISGCVNNADIIYTGKSGGEKISIGGICGSTGENGKGITGCINNGNVISSTACRAGGFVGHNESVISGCTNTGCVLSGRSDTTGPAWGCSYNRFPEKFTGNKGLGHVGEYDQWKDNPQGADSDAYLNAVAIPASEGYDLEKVKVDSTSDSYYDWTAVTSKEVCRGMTYTHYSCDNVPRQIHVLEIDLSDPGIEVTTAYANDCVPNPNGNGNHNNGFKIRETLSQLCERKRKEGHEIVAGINTGFFDSDDGISRGFHIEEGQPVYINNPTVVSTFPNHSWGFTIFTDGTASCERKRFTGKIKAGEREFYWFSMNDTIVRHTSKEWQINLYNSRYRKTPHPAHPELTNPLAKDALYIIAEYDGSPMIVNNGYASAKVIEIADGRTSPLAEAPYISSGSRVGIALSGSMAKEVRSLVSVGSQIWLCCDIFIDGEEKKPIYTQNATMYHILKNGQNNLSSIPSGNSIFTKKNPLTFAVAGKDKRKIWLVEVDGRQGWYSTGVTGYEMYRIAEKLGGYNMTRFDGGGSSAMWVYDSESGKGNIVNSVSDKNGERSCLNYMLIKKIK